MDEPDNIAVDVARLHGAFEKLLSEARRVVRQVEFAAEVQKRSAAVLVATVLKMAGSTSAAIGRNDGVEASIFLRSLLEAFVDLKLVLDDPRHVVRLEAVVLRQRRRVLQAACETGVPTTFLRSIAGFEGSAAELAKVRRRLDELRKQGFKPLEIREKFARAGYLDYYEGPYSLLCDQAHNNLNALATRHFRETDDGPAIYMSTPTTDEDLFAVAETAATIVSRAVLHVKELIDGTEPTGLEDLVAALVAVRSCARGGSLGS